jgi:4-hydroxymandelate oxidase
VNPDISRLEQQARGLLPAPVYDYYAGGAGRERTLRANERAWARTWLAPRMLRDVSVVDTATTLLGCPVATPLAVAPTAFHRLAHPDGEVATAAGAARAGALLVVSTRSTRTLEDVAAAAGPWWFQVYIMADRSHTARLVRRAAAAGASALVLTADTPQVGRKRRDSDDLVIPDEDYLANLGQLEDLSGTDQDATVTVADIAWLSDISGGLPVVVKGVLRPDDALACAAAGAAAVMVSNHGGRQLDGAIPTAAALPGIAAALQATPVTPITYGAQTTGVARAPGAEADGWPGGVPAYVDGGVRSGEDALAALALGARAVLLGRPVLWALACGGADGVAELLTGLTDGLAHAMALAGAASLAEVAGVADVPAAARGAAGADLAGAAGSG